MRRKLVRLYRQTDRKDILSLLKRKKKKKLRTKYPEKTKSNKLRESQGTKQMQSVYYYGLTQLLGNKFCGRFTRRRRRQSYKKDNIQVR